MPVFTAMKTNENRKCQQANSTRYVSDREMAEILKDKALVASLKAGLRDLKAGNYKIVK